MLRHVWFQADAWISRTTPLTPPSYEVGGIAKRIKPLAFGEKPNPVGPPIIVVLYWISTIWRGREVSRPYHAKSFLGDTTSFQELILLSVVFLRERASGFYPWGNVVAPRKRVEEGLCGGAAWKLVSNDAKRTVAPPNAKHSTLLQGCCLCFCFFDSIHDSATMHNLSLRLFHWAEKCLCGALVRWCVCRYVKKCLMFWFSCYNSWIFS